MRALRWPRLWLALYWLLLLALVVVCVIPAPPDPLPLRHSDKFYHLLGYALLAGFTVQLFAAPALWPRLCVLLAFGVALEGVQWLLPWRSADALDAVANALGVGVGALLSFTPLARALQWVEARMPLRSAARGERTLR